MTRPRRPDLTTEIPQVLHTDTPLGTGAVRPKGEDDSSFKAQDPRHALRSLEASRGENVRTGIFGGVSRLFGFTRNSHPLSPSQYDSKKLDELTQQAIQGSKHSVDDLVDAAENGSFDAIAKLGGIMTTSFEPSGWRSWPLAFPILKPVFKLFKIEIPADQRSSAQLALQKLDAITLSRLIPEDARGNETILLAFDALQRAENKYLGFFAAKALPNPIIELIRLAKQENGPAFPAWVKLIKDGLSQMELWPLYELALFYQDYPAHPLQRQIESALLAAPIDREVLRKAITATRNDDRVHLNRASMAVSMDNNESKIRIIVQMLWETTPSGTLSLLPESAWDDMIGALTTGYVPPYRKRQPIQEEISKIDSEFLTDDYDKFIHVMASGELESLHLVQAWIVYRLAAEPDVQGHWSSDLTLKRELFASIPEQTIDVMNQVMPHFVKVLTDYGLSLPWEPRLPSNLLQSDQDWLLFQLASAGNKFAQNRILHKFEEAFQDPFKNPQEVESEIRSLAQDIEPMALLPESVKEFKSNLMNLANRWVTQSR